MVVALSLASAEQLKPGIFEFICGASSSQSVLKASASKPQIWPLNHGLGFGISVSCLLCLFLFQCIIHLCNACVIDTCNLKQTYHQTTCV